MLRSGPGRFVFFLAMTPPYPSPVAPFQAMEFKALNPAGTDDPSCLPHRKEGEPLPGDLRPLAIATYVPAAKQVASIPA